ncbi:protein NO VEIN domain-containing protein [Ornithinimicrobium cerasi]|uniref:Protein NO VEIN C-terminal domain-containing protein n=1 Tax=Ornithinimicrobium cerasi TaxID=2248773 RepID=A0A285VAX9_9MICO|nr:DUF3883 domain-containing protein [Ornithinimicrobium cerasi]SOC51127.1 protein of unknown function [Ornithinimicrobium cerasi]
MRTFLMTYNPDLWDQSEDEWNADLSLIAADGTAPGRWSTGSRTDMSIGDRVYLLRQGPRLERGILARGWTTSEPYPLEHWDGQGGSATYVDVVWDSMATLDNPLPTDVLLQQVPQVPWNNLMSSGIQVRDPAAVDRLEELWTDHLGQPTSDGPPSGPVHEGQGHLQDARTRSAIENYAQSVLMQHYRAQGWDVKDRRVGNPFDAEATRGGQTIFLEAKGTTGSGTAVFVTAGEVQFASTHPGRTTMGIVSGIEVTPDGDEVRATGGTLRVLEWNPGHGQLRPVQYQWRPETPDEVQA